MLPAFICGGAIPNLLNICLAVHFLSHTASSERHPFQYFALHLALDSKKE